MNREPLNCAETVQRLDDYLDRELSAEELAAVEQHLEQCAGCAGAFAVERDLLDAIRAKLTRLRMPAGLMARISSRLNEQLPPGAPGVASAGPAGARDLPAWR